jgi:hypothetical protein
MEASLLTKLRCYQQSRLRTEVSYLNGAMRRPKSRVYVLWAAQVLVQYTPSQRTRENEA